VGYLVDRFSYTPAFVAAGLMPIVATVCLFFLISPLSANPSETTIVTE
jgi:ACS family hexuronate transporter-like MFS transporter